MTSSVIGALRVVLGLDSAQFERGISRVSRSNKRLVTNTQAASNAVRGLAASLGIVSAGAAARGFLSLTDQSKQLTAQLKLATAQTGSFAKAQEDVKRIASSTRGGLKETADLYAAFQRNSLELGITQQQAARATETVSKAFVISGATAAEAAGGLRQFLQGLQSGVLRGEELNSVLENAPRLARALADGLGVTIGQLRAMGKEGELTGERVVRALEDAATSIDAEFAQMPVTFEQAMTDVHNAAILTFGAFDDGGQFSTALSNFITGGTEGFADMENAARSFGTTVSSELSGFIAVSNSAVNAINSIADAWGGWPGQVISDLNTIARLVNPITLGMEAIQRNPIYQEAKNERKLGLVSSRIMEADPFADVGGWGGYNRTGGTAPAISAASGGGKKTGGGKKGPSAESLRRRADAEARRAADALRRFLDMVAREQADLAEAQAQLTGITDELAAARLQQIEAERASRDRAYKADDSLDAAQREELQILNNKNASAQADLVRKEQREAKLEKAERIAIDGLNREMELLALTGDLARTAAGQRDVELRILDLAFERERLGQEGIRAREAVNSAEWRNADALLRSLPRRHAMARTATLEATQGPLESYLDRLPRTADEAREALERVQVDGIDGIIDGLADAATGARSLGDVFKSVTNQIIADLIRIQLRKAIVGALSSAIGGGGGIDFGALGGNTAAGMGSKSLAGLQSSLPGFATGGSFKVGGMPGVDRNIVAFKATRGEMVDIRKPGNSGGGNSYHFTGNLMTPEFWEAIQAGDQSAAIGGAKLAGQQSSFAASRRLG